MAPILNLTFDNIRAFCAMLSRAGAMATRYLLSSHFERSNRIPTVGIFITVRSSARVPMKCKYFLSVSPDQWMYEGWDQGSDIPANLSLFSDPCFWYFWCRDNIWCRLGEGETGSGEQYVPCRVWVILFGVWNILLFNKNRFSPAPHQWWNYSVKLKYFTLELDTLSV